ncbi:hypothetical protein C8R43DRAFT_1240624 [Mycena crocata]|nr:hypothetical protein C8R43DRAFT_1240624 [Mycena crocata]
MSRSTYEALPVADCGVTDSLLPTGSNPSYHESHSKPPGSLLRRHKICIAAGAAFAFLALFAVLRGDGLQARVASLVQRPAQQSDAKLESHPDKRRVFLRVGSVGSEGMGTTLNHFKSSIVLSGALDSELLLASSRNPHGYSATDIFNRQGNIAAVDEDFSVKACRLGDYLRRQDRANLVKGLCDGDPLAKEKMDTIRTMMANCTSILDTADASESVPHLNGCIMGWVRDRLIVPRVDPPRLTLPPTRPVTVGVHIRWGDTASSKTNITSNHGFYGSMKIPDIVRILKDIRTLAGPELVKVTVNMENANPDVLALLNDTDYTLVDSGDDYMDLQALSNNDILLLGMSSYGVLSHLIAPAGLTISTREGWPLKYGNTTEFGRQTVYLQDYTPDSLKLAFLG